MPTEAQLVPLLLVVLSELAPVPPLDPAPASPEPEEPTGWPSGTPSVPVAAEPESVLEALLETDIVLMVVDEAEEF